MARLFITDREFNFFSDIVKEVMKDISGQSVYYYPVNYSKTNPSDVYQESMEKIFDKPLYLPAVVEYLGQEANMEAGIVSVTAPIKVHLHKRDMDDNGIVPSIGDYIQFGEVNYEIKKVLNPDMQYGQIEHKYWYSVECIQSDTKVFYREPEPILNLQQATKLDYFTQIRGEVFYDKRDLQAPDLVGKPLTGAKSSPFELDDDE
jgi:hypothetical protein